MDYKKIIKNQKIRFKILKKLKFVPDSFMVSMQYLIKLGRVPNLKKPKRFTEKLQWYKLYYREPLMTQASDKFAVREYIESKGLSHILNKLYKVYNEVEEVEIEELPEKFVIKTTNGSGTNYFCKDKSRFPIEKVKSSLSEWIDRDIYASGREWSYKNIQPKIIVEELLESNENTFEGINDYKFLCFNGKPEYVVVDVDRHIKHKRNIYDIEWNLIDVSTDHPNFKTSMEKPEGLEKMLEIAKVLSEDFPFVRVDLYWVNQQIFFGELTFYPWTGYVQFEPDEFDFILGKLFKINKMII